MFVLLVILRSSSLRCLKLLRKEFFLLFHNSGRKRGCRSWKGEFCISSLFFPPSHFFFVAFLDQNHVSSWSGWIYTYKALRWRSLRRKFFSLLGGKTRCNKCLGRARVCAVYIYTTYIYLYIYCYEWCLLSCITLEEGRGMDWFKCIL